MSAVVFTGFLFVAATLEGNLGGPADLADGLRDVGSLFGFFDGHAPPEKMTLLRDVPSLAAVLAIGVQTGNVYRQWRAIEAMPAEMAGPSNSNSVIIDHDGRLASEIRNANTYFRRVRDFGLFAGIFGVTAGVLIASSHARDGVYQLYFGEDGRADAQDLYSTWWAQDVNPLGLLGVLGVIMLAAYYLVLQNAVGVRVLVVIAKATMARMPDPTQAPVGSRPGEVAARASNEPPTSDEADVPAVDFRLDLGDGVISRGWDPMDRIFRSIFTAIFASMTVIFFLTIQVSPRGSLVFLWGWFIFAVLNPMYVFIPMLVFRSRIKAWKTVELERLQNDIDSARESGNEDRVSVLQLQRSTLKDTREWPFKGVRYLVGPALYILTVVPGSMAIWDAISK